MIDLPSSETVGVVDSEAVWENETWEKELLLSKREWMSEWMNEEVRKRQSFDRNNWAVYNLDSHML